MRINPEIHENDYHGFHCSICESMFLKEFHRIKTVRKEASELYRFIEQEFIRTEKNILNILGLPTIEKIELFNQGLIEDESGYFEMNEAKRERWITELASFQYKLIEDSAIKRKSIISTAGEWGKRMFNVFGNHLGYVWNDILKYLPPSLTRSWFEKTKVRPDFSDEYFQGILSQGIGRVKNKIYLQHFNVVVEQMIQRTMQGQSALQVASYFHSRYGGNLSDWERTVQSELTLVMNQAFYRQARASGARYEVWSAAKTACDICAPLDGRIWQLGKGPDPVTHTHPRCACIKYATYLAKGNVRDPWDRPTPYAKPWTREEIEALRE